MQRIRIERKAPVRDRHDRYAVLPLDPRDPDIVRAKLLQHRGSSDRATSGAAGATRRERPTSAR